MNNTLINHLYEQYNHFLKEPCWSRSQCLPISSLRFHVHQISLNVLSSFFYIPVHRNSMQCVAFQGVSRFSPNDSQCINLLWQTTTTGFHSLYIKTTIKLCIDVSQWPAAELIVFQCAVSSTWHFSLGHDFNAFAADN